MDQLWQGCFISESLKDPRILNKYRCSKFRITSDQLPLDNKGNRGHWHMFWIQAPASDFYLFQDNIKYNWYGHFWQGNKIVAIFEGRMFELDKEDKSTWQEAIAYGESQNISAEQLDFLTD